MDPLSIGSAVLGLIAGASRIAPVLYHFITHTHDAPKTASQILEEMNSITASLGQLQTCLTGATTSNIARRSMLSLRNIVATLTACVTTYSDLEIVVKKCVGDGRVRKVKWVINEADIGELVQRVQAHKLSLTLMLTILQCESMQEAESSMNRLIGVVEGLVASNIDIRMRMDGLAAQHAQCQSATTEEGLDSTYSSLTSSAFESDLETSRVYRKLRPRTSFWSLSTSQQGSMATAAFSDLTMDDVSKLSVLRLPIWSTEVSNTQDYRSEAEDLTPRASPTLSAQDELDDPTYISMIQGLDREDVRATEPLAKYNVTVEPPTKQNKSAWRPAVRLWTRKSTGEGPAILPAWYSPNIELASIIPERPRSSPEARLEGYFEQEDSSPPTLHAMSRALDGIGAIFEPPRDTFCLDMADFVLKTHSEQEDEDDSSGEWGSESASESDDEFSMETHDFGEIKVIRRLPVSHGYRGPTATKIITGLTQTIPGGNMDQL